MAQFQPTTAPAKPQHSRVASPPLAATFVEIEDTDGPRAAYTALSRHLDHIRDSGADVPVELARLQQRLLTECCALSQGR